MNCEHAWTLISSQLAVELKPADQALLAAHLQECPSCVATAEAFRIQHGELRDAFVPRRAATAATAEHVAARLAGRPSTHRRRALIAVAGALTAAAAAVVAMALYISRPRGNDVAPDGGEGPRPAVAEEIFGLTPRPRPTAPAAAPLAVGDEVRTGVGERRRVALPDGSVLFVNEQTWLRLAAERRVVLATGEVFAQVAPQVAGRDAFVVESPRREVIAAGTQFDVRADGGGSDLVVIQGSVGLPDPKSSGRELSTVVRAGEQLGRDQVLPSPAPRASHLLDWTRDLMAAAESPLVPASEHGGGDLIAVDPSGQESKLSLRKYHIDVHIEDGFARTTIDQTYFNHNPWRLEGTFYFPLPPDASLSRLAMYVDGQLMEGGMAERDYARQVYERILYSQRDPALLEWVDGSTFKMRVFPLEGRQEKRIVLSYTQRLPSAYGRPQYRFPAGHSLALVRDWSLHVRYKNGAAADWTSASHPRLKAQVDGRDLVLEDSAHEVAVNRDVVLSFTEREKPGEGDGLARWSSAEQDGARYLMLRYRPRLEVKQQRHRRHWVFLFESSGDREPLLARVQVDVIHGLLAHAEHDDTFAVLTAGTNVRSLNDNPQPVTPENVKDAIAFLERTHLIGALDLGKALEATSPFLGGDETYLVHVGGGHAAMGERRDAELARAVPDGAHYVGVGVGKRWNRAFMKAAAERTGGYVTQVNPDEPVAWRAFEMYATLVTPRLLDVKVTDANEKVAFLTYTNAIAHGEEACAIARIDAPMPKSVIVSGTLDGKPYLQTVPVRDVTPDAGYLPRTWAKLEIDRLLAEDAAKHRPQIVELSKAMYVMTPFTSLLVLENEEMYRQFNVDRGRKDHWAMYPCPDKIPVIYEPDPLQPIDARNAPKTPKPQANQVLQTIVVRVPPRILTWSGQPDRLGGRQVVTALDVYSGALGLAEALKAQRDDSLLLNLGDLQDFEMDGRIDVAKKEHFATWFGLDGLPPIDGFAFAPNDRLPALRAASLGKRANKNVRGQVPDLGLDLESLDLGVRLREAGDLGEFQAGRLARPYRFMSDGARIMDLRSDPYGGYLLGEAQRASAGFKAGLYFSTASVDKDRKEGKKLSLLRNGLLSGQHESPSLYSRPGFSGDERVFADLIAYAPGLNTSGADIQAVLEAEAAPDLRSAPGQVDPRARQLIERARQAGWQALTLPGGRLVFDGRGRYVADRTLALGLREQVVCDGATLLHLYPDLGLAARRSVSRFHRAELAGVVSWLLPPAEDLARGADVRWVNEHTVAVVPRGVEAVKDDDGKPVPHAVMHLIFAPDGRLSERRLVQMPGEKTLVRETYLPDGVVRVSDADGKQLDERKLSVAAAGEPDLRPDTSRLVVLPLPWRARQHVYTTLDLDPNRPLNADENACFEYLGADDALALLATEFVGQSGPHVALVHEKCFRAHGDRRLGFYTLRLACGVNVTADPDFRRLAAEHAEHPLVRYLTLQGWRAYAGLQRAYGLDLGGSVDPDGGFFGRLAELRDLHLFWRQGHVGGETRRQRALDYVRRNQSSVLGLAALALVQDRAGNDPAAQGAIAQAWQGFGEDSGLAYVAGYEHARCLLHAGHRDEARTAFSRLYKGALRRGGLPPIDGDFRQALQSDGTDVEMWVDAMLAAAAAGHSEDPKGLSPEELAAKCRRAFDLAWQCWQLGDPALSDDLLDRALHPPAYLGLKPRDPDAERLATELTTVAFLRQTGRPALAAERLQALLDDARSAGLAPLWRLASQLAGQRGLSHQALEYLDRALDLEYPQLPAVVNLEEVRRDYGTLLNHYQGLADGAAALKAEAPADLAARTVRAADRWRALDRENAAPCEAAARVLRTLGRRDLAWEYLTTPAGLRPGEGSPWLGMAQTLSREGELELADRAYAAAFAADPANAQLLWDRAQNLRRLGKDAEAHAVFRRLAEGSWHPRYAWIADKARWQQ